MKFKFLKFAAISVFLAIFAFACANQSSTNTANTANTPNVNTAQTSAANQPKSDEFAATREIYTKNCVKCHKENGEGGNVTIDGETIKVPNYKDPKHAAHSDAKFIEIIEAGDEGMPAFKKRLSADDIKGLVAFIRHEYQGK